MQFKHTEMPALKLLVLMVFGIFIGIKLHPGNFILFFSLSISILLILVSIYYNRKYAGFIAGGITIGLWLSIQITSINISAPNKIYPEFPAVVQGEIVKTLKVSENNYRCIVHGSIDAKPLPKINNTRILLTVTGLNKKPKNMIAGNIIYATVNAKTPQSLMLKTDFPEKQYAAGLDVQWLARANSKKVAILNHPSGFDYFRESSITNIQKRIELLFGESLSGVVIALLTGDQTKIPYSTREVFTQAGTAHILSVGGWHVGVIASIIFAMLGFIRNRWIKFALFALLVIAFVVFTGMQAAAIRAGIMAIMILLIYNLQKHINIINVISLSIIFLLLWSPELIYSIGFQMSYCAIIGIAVLFQPIQNFFKKIFKSDNLVIKYITASFAMTFSASIILSPMAAYYFNNFSIISPIANLFVIPLISAGMVFALIGLILSYIYFPIAVLYANSSEFLLTLAQRVNAIASSLPYSHLEGNITIWLSILLSLAILYVIFANNFRQILLRISVSTLIILFFLKSYNIREFANSGVYPREKYVAVLAPITATKTFVYLCDRQPKQYPGRDISIEKFLTKHTDSLVIFYTGNAGSSVVDQVKKKRHIEFADADLITQRKIESALKLKRNIPQIIDIK